MKLSLTVEADTVNVLALNGGRIAVDIDGIELAELIDVVCDNGCTLRVTDTPGEPGVENPFPSASRLNGIQCSITHITHEDNAILDLVSLQHHDGANSDWILYTSYGYLLRLNARRHPVLELRRMGLSKTCRWLVATLIHSDYTDIIHLDASGERLPGFATFNW
ncbi:DUF5983 family protein [Klebsiella aerogenes]|uniref:DUF5983 family protein n=1 Tax=Klebsiella aerogenes TaxID=548 RepID=UPI0023BA0297|nr:DUF5983 family protein [Klebsiella aerogenes]ELA1888041.1 hypothetical protein [Klebsiella aerogenes]MDF0548043.1 DUF5983 family protein [Klebsiella aerogenes]